MINLKRIPWNKTRTHPRMKCHRSKILNMPFPVCDNGSKTFLVFEQVRHMGHLLMVKYWTIFWENRIKGNWCDLELMHSLSDFQQKTNSPSQLFSMLKVSWYYVSIIPMTKHNGKRNFNQYTISLHELTFYCPINDKGLKSECIPKINCLLMHSSQWNHWLRLTFISETWG